MKFNNKDNNLILKNQKDHNQSEIKEINQASKEQIQYVTQNIFEYDWSTEMRGQLLSHISEPVVWYIFETMFFSLKSGEVIEKLQLAFNNITKIHLSKQMLDVNHFDQHCFDLIRTQNRNQRDFDFKNMRNKLKIEDLIKILLEQSQSHNQIMRTCFEKIRNLVENYETELQANQILNQIILNRDKIPNLIPLENFYLEYLEKKHVNQIHLPIENQKQPKIQVIEDDILCHICNDGDYQDNNLIVICSKCNLSVHQKCYYIEHVPQGDWICDNCKSFHKDGMYTSCPICPCLSGAIKPTNIKVLDYLETENKEQLSQLYVFNINTSQKDIFSKEINENGLFYDFNKIQKTFYQGPSPYHEMVWTHISCAKQSQQFLIERKRTMQIKFIKQNTISKSQISNCVICGLKGFFIILESGSQKKCSHEKCEKTFHIECARREGFFFYQNPDQKQNNKIFCKQHTPLKLRRILQQNKTHKSQEIFKFYSNFESHVIYQKKVEDEQIEDIQIQNFTDLQFKEYQLFMQKLKEIYQKYEKNLFYIDYQVVKSDKSKLYIQSTNIPKKIEKTIMNIQESDNFWRIFKYKKLNRKQCFKKYLEALNIDKLQKIEYVKIIFRKINKKCSEFNKKIQKNNQIIQLSFNNVIIFNAAIQEVQDFSIYCICKNLYTSGEEMVQCETCDNWYHYHCVGFTGTEEQLSKIDYYCKKCEEKDDPLIVKERHFKVYDLLQCWVFDYQKDIYSNQLNETEVQNSTHDDQEQEQELEQVQIKEKFIESKVQNSTFDEQDILEKKVKLDQFQI